MIEDIVKQINHLGYKITQDPLDQNTWKIASPNSDDGLFSLEMYNNTISLHKGEKCICQIDSNDDPFLILRHLPSNLFGDVNNGFSKSSTINTLFDFCKAESESEKRLITRVLNSKKLDQFKNRRDFAFNVFHTLKDAGINVKNNNYDLSIIDIISSIL